MRMLYFAIPHTTTTARVTARMMEIMFNSSSAFLKHYACEGTNLETTKQAFPSLGCAYLTFKSGMNTFGQCPVVPPHTKHQSASTREEIPAIGTPRSRR